MMNAPFLSRRRGALSLLRPLSLSSLLLIAPGAAVRADDLPPAGVAAEPAVLDLDFRELLSGPVGARGPVWSERLRAADGRRVRITGYMVTQEIGRPGRFFLAPRPLAMSEHADGEADDLPPTVLTVLMPPQDAEVVPLPTRGRLQLTGTLRVGRAELDDGRIVWLRLELEPRRS